MGSGLNKMDRTYFISIDEDIPMGFGFKNIKDVDKAVKKIHPNAEKFNLKNDPIEWTHGYGLIEFYLDGRLFEWNIHSIKMI